MRIARAPDEATEHRVGGDVLRVGRRAIGIGAVVAALVIQFVAVAPRIGEHCLQVALLTGHDQSLGPAVVRRIIADPGPAANQTAVVQEILRILGDEADRPGHAVAAVQCRCRTAQDLHRLQQVEVDIIAAPDRLRTEAEGIRHPHAVDGNQDAVAFQPADVEAAVAVATGRRTRRGEPGRCPAYRHAGFVTDQILDVSNHPVVDRGGIDHRNGLRHILDPFLATCRGHGNFAFVRRALLTFAAGNCRLENGLCRSHRGQDAKVQGRDGNAAQQICRCH